MPLRRRVLILSFVCEIAALIASAIPFVFVNVYLPLRKLAEANAQALQRARCDQQACDMSEITADPEFEPPDYIVDRRSIIFLQLLPRLSLDFH